MTDDSGFPATGTPRDDLLAELDQMHRGDLDWRSGRSFSLVYHPDDPGLEDVLHEVGLAYLHENGLNPFKYPSLVQIEADIVRWAAALLGTVPKAGSLTSGGTESIFLAVHTAREHARATRGITAPTLVTAETAHPAFAKACHYLSVEHVRVPVREDLRADPEAMADAIDDRTAMVVGSAPCYPFGVIDPIPELAAAAAERGALCHVDACLGGWLLPFWERLGEPVPPWDFRVEGVTSMSADLHKYGYAFKGASTILYADPSMVSYQWFVYDEWPGGLYGSVTTAGTRPAAPMAGAWAAIRYLGEEGYLRKAAEVREATRAFVAGIEAIEGLEVHGRPDLSVFEFGSATLDIAAVGDQMDDRGWNLDRQQGGLHAMLFPYHRHVADQFCADLADSVASHGASRGVEAGYGGIVRWGGRAGAGTLQAGAGSRGLEEDHVTAEGLPEIDVAELARRRHEGAWVLDVRQPEEYEEVRVPGAVSIPLAEVPDHLHEIPTDQEVLVVCRSGARSARATEFLRANGVEATNVAGGTMAWIEAGHPSDQGPAAS